MTKPPLILGTAEFNPEGYAGKPPIKEEEIVRILGLAEEEGLTLMDTAESYECQHLIQKYAQGWCIYTKTRDWKVTLAWGKNELRGILYHYQQGELPVELPHIHRWVNLGASVYTLKQLPENKLRIIQVPYNILDDKFEPVFGEYRTVFVRSVFANGKALEQHTVKECLDFVARQRPDGIIIGVNSAKELEKILEVY